MSFPGANWRQQNQPPSNNNNNNFPPQGGYGGYNQPPPMNQGYNQGPPPQQFGGYNNGPPQGGFNSGPPMNQGFPGGGMPMPGSVNFGFQNNMPPNNNQPPNFEARAHNMPFTQNQPQGGGNNNYGGGPGGNFGGPPPPPYQGNSGQQNTQTLPPNQPVPQGFQQGQQIQVSNFSGKKRALLVGINYFKTKAELRGCINDVHNVRNFISQHYGFRQENMVILTDDQKDPNFIPTRQNMINAMKWLVSNAQPNDSFFFHFSGHGSQQKDTDGDEDDGFDETICPLDYDKAGMIVDDELNSIMVKPLPQGCRLTAIFDCCHSGTALDLPYVYNQEGKLKEYNPGKAAQSALVSVGQAYMMGDLIGAAMNLKNGLSKVTGGKKAAEKSQKEKGSLADVVMFSGCKDTQTSADTHEQSIGATGAMSFALISSLKSDPYGLTYIQLLNSVRQILRGKYQQLPQLSSGRPMDMNSKFMM